MNTSSLFSLPAELRNRIYELALCQPAGITISVSEGRPHLLYSPIEIRHLLALTQTCRILSSESSPVFYEVNEFTFVSKYLREQRHPGNLQNRRNTLWQHELFTRLDCLGPDNVRALSHITIDIGTSFLYDYVPSCESIWRSVASVLDRFSSKTKVYMKTKLNWTYESHRTFDLSMSLSDPVAALRVVDEGLQAQKDELEPWCIANNIGPRRIEYMRVELATCAQELRGFVHLLEIMSRNGQ